MKLNKQIHQGYPDKLNYSDLISPGVMLMKDGALLAGWEFSGPDLESASSQELNSLAAQINAAFISLGDGWMIHHNLIRFPALSYPGTGHFPDATSKLFDLERKEQYEKAGTLFENLSSLVITYKAPDSAEKIANKLFIEGQIEESKELDRIEALFLNKLEQIEASLSACLRLKRMGDLELLTLLHSCATGLDQPILLPDIPIELSHYIGSQDLITGFYPQIGDKHFVVIGVTGYPAHGVPEILAEITKLSIPLRFSTRFIFSDPYSAEKKIDRRRSYWEQKRTRISDMFARSMKFDESGHVDQHADLMMHDSLEAQAEAASGHVRYGHFTLSIILSAETRNEALENARQIRKELQNRGFNARVETFNAMEAFLGSLPGHGYYNVRKPILHSLNLAHLAPFSSMWAGEEFHPSPFYPEESPAQMYCVSSGQTPFRLNTFVDDVGSTIVIGPTGSGKTVLLNSLALQDFRYKDMQVFYFDKDYGAYFIAKATAGEHYDLLGQDKDENKHKISLYPLKDIKNIEERNWAADFIEILFSQQGISINAKQRKYIQEALDRLASSDSKTLTELLIPQDKDLQTALKYYQLGGASGGILDGSYDSLGKNRFQVFEQSNLLKKGDKLVVPTLSYLFHRIEQAMDGRPTKIYIDEAWVNLMNTMSLEQVEDWLRTIRKKNGALILATQSMLEISNSSIRDLILESCPTKIFLPNPEATNPATRRHYEDIGLTSRQISLIANAVRKRDYYYISTAGKRLFSLNLSSLGLNLVGVNGKKSQSLIDQLIKEHKDNWPAAWLEEQGLETYSQTWRELNNEIKNQNEDINSDLFLNFPLQTSVSTRCCN